MTDYDPAQGDDIGLYIWLLLENLPLNRVGLVWSKETQTMRPPASTQRVPFHRRFATKIAPRLGRAPSLGTWTKVLREWLTEKCPPGTLNGFGWRDSFLTLQEIDHIAVATTYQYALARLQVAAMHA